MKFASFHLIFLVFTAFFTLVIFFKMAFIQRRQSLRLFAQKELLEGLLDRVSFEKKRLKASLLLGAFFCALLALMRPQWGFRWEESHKKGIDILIALDVSRSMLAADVKPSRLARAKLALEDFVKSLGGDRIGLIAFSGTAFLQCPLTSDYNGFLLVLDNVDTQTIPQGGTSISSAIREAIRAYKDVGRRDKTLVLITDGEDHQGDPLATAREAKEAGVTVHAIGLGTQEGDLIVLSPQESQPGGYLKDAEGNVVKTRLDEKTLEEIALATGGVYVRAQGREFGLDLLKDRVLSKIEKASFQGKKVKRYEERFQIFVGLALLLLFGEFLIDDRRDRGLARGKRES
jgi:Ca-activated chloride channel family protein